MFLKNIFILTSFLLFTIGLNSSFAKIQVKDRDLRASLKVLTQKERDQLFPALYRGDSETVKSLLEKSYVDIKSRRGKTPLIIASAQGYKDIVEWLIDQGAFVDAQDNDGYTALMLAGLHGNKSIVSLLLSKEAKVDIKSYIYRSNAYWGNEFKGAGDTALLFASAGGYPEIVELLLDYGADVNFQNKFGETALIKASTRVLIQNRKEVYRRYVETVRVLLNNKADAHIKDWIGSTALGRAGMIGHSEITMLLLSHGAQFDMETIKQEMFGFLPYAP